MKRFIIILSLYAGWITPNFLHASELESEHHDHEKSDNDIERTSKTHKEIPSSSDDHDSNTSKIDPEYIEKSGIIISVVSEESIAETMPLTGRITLNQDRTYDLRARFPGSIQNVSANWGQEVKKGEILATIESNTSLKSYNILSPVDGIVLVKNTNIGDVADAKILFTIADLSSVWGELHVFPKDLPLIKEGLPVTVSQIESRVKSTTSIKAILPTADPLSQTAIALINIPNKEGMWRPGMTIEGNVSIGAFHAKHAVTNEAIQWLDGKTVVFIKEGESTYEPRAVELGRKDNKYIEIVSGLQGGEQYVSHGSFVIKSDILKATAEHSH